MTKVKIGTINRYWYVKKGLEEEFVTHTNVWKIK